VSQDEGRLLFNHFIILEATGIRFIIRIEN